MFCGDPGIFEPRRFLDLSFLLCRLVRAENFLPSPSRVIESPPRRSKVRAWVSPVSAWKTSFY
jgi:hypothetical protein